MVDVLVQREALAICLPCLSLGVDVLGDFRQDDVTLPVVPLIQNERITPMDGIALGLEPFGRNAAKSRLKGSVPRVRP